MFNRAMTSTKGFVGLRLDQEIIDALDSRAVKEGVTRSDLITQAILVFLGEDEAQKMLKQILQAISEGKKREARLDSALKRLNQNLGLLSLPPMSPAEMDRRLRDGTLRRS